MRPRSESNVLKKQQRWYSGKQKCHTYKVQVGLETNSGRIINTQCTRGSVHDFTLFKRTYGTWRYRPDFIADKGYEGIHRLGCRAITPIKKPKHRSLEREQRVLNREIHRRRIKIEHVFAALKTFKILGSRYRNRRRRLLLRFNLIAGIYNREIAQRDL